MAKIETVDYEKIPSQAAKMRELGLQLNNEFTVAYLSVNDMRNDWYGKRYNALLVEFNKLIKTLNDMLKLIVTDVPFSLETVANNYSNADQGVNACQAQETAYIKINELQPSTAVGLRFLTDSVSATQTKVSANFDKANEYMTNIEQVLNGMTWESEAASTFKEQFRTMKKNIVDAIGEIKTSFENNMKSTKEEIQAAETANTI
ncbi:MAG TPA: hypothetical protein PK737_01560 [Bacilli bacterium]|nr:hypothetical protein [Bacilli bacterium]